MNYNQDADSNPMFTPVFTAYREEETYGPDPSMMRENCLVQTTEWSACSKTCGLGISTRVTNDNRECRLEKQTRLCMVRPCESQLEQSIRVSSCYKLHCFHKHLRIQYANLNFKRLPTKVVFIFFPILAEREEVHSHSQTLQAHEV